VNTALARRKLLADNKREILEALARFDSVFNILGSPPAEMLDEEVQQLIDDRQEARRRREFDRADQIRDELLARGIILEDTKDGVRWKRK
jgi:cysteinyl-tRNA synthetase